MKTVLLVLFVLYVTINSQYAYQSNHLRNTVCNAKPHMGVYYSNGKCYQRQGQFFKVECVDLLTSHHSRCDSECKLCRDTQRIPNACYPSGPNSVAIKCGALPELKPKGVLYSVFQQDTCNPSAGQNYFLSDAFCFNQSDRLAARNFTGLNPFKFEKGQNSIQISWNEEKRSGEINAYQFGDCKGDPAATILFPEKKCSKLGNDYVIFSKP